MSYLRRFGAFLYDFLVGDSWELFVGPIAALVLAAVLLPVLGPALTGGLLFVAVVAIAATSVIVALRGSA